MQRDFPARVGVIELGVQPLIIQAQRRRHKGRIVDCCSLRSREFADPVYRIMVVEGEQQAAFGANGKDFPDQFESSGCVEREDQNVFVRAGIEITQTDRRALSRYPVIATEVGLPECGLPKTPERNSFMCSSS